MDSMDEKQYIEQRLDNQIEWYDFKSKQNQKWYKRLKLIEIILATTIPFLVGYVSEKMLSLKLVVGLLGVLVAVISGILALYKFQENWTEYRTTCESLRHEKYLFLTKSEPYNVEESLPLLVQRVEALISKEHNKWSQYIKAHKKKQVVNSTPIHMNKILPQNFQTLSKFLLNEL